MSNGEISKISNETKTVEVMHGKEALRWLTQHSKSQRSPLLSPDAFFEWASQITEQKMQSTKPNEFQKRRSIVDVLNRHEKELSFSQEARDAAYCAWKNDASFASHAQLTKQHQNISKVIDKMKAEVAKKIDMSEKKQRVQILLVEKLHHKNEIEKDLDKIKQNAQLLRYQAAYEAHEQLLRDIGLRQKEQELQSMLLMEGRSKGKSGFRFEDEAESVVHENLLSSLAHRYSVSIHDLIVARNITFKMASVGGSPGEFDIVVCQKCEDISEIKADASLLVDTSKKGNQSENVWYGVVVLAIIEVKKNCDDVGKSFLHYQDSLDWLCGIEENYDINLWKTKKYPSGHFDRPFVHCLPHKGKAVQKHLVFTKHSFNRIKENRIELKLPHQLLSDTSHNRLPKRMSYCSDIYFVTKASTLHGLCSKDMNVILHKLSTNCAVHRLERILAESSSIPVKCQQYHEALRHEIEKIREESLKSSTWFCTQDLITILEESKLYDQIYCLLDIA